MNLTFEVGESNHQDVACMKYYIYTQYQDGNIKFTDKSFHSSLEIKEYFESLKEQMIKLEEFISKIEIEEEQTK